MTEIHVEINETSSAKAESDSRVIISSAIDKFKAKGFGPILFIVFLNPSLLPSNRRKAIDGVEEMFIDVAKLHFQSKNTVVVDYKKGNKNKFTSFVSKIMTAPSEDGETTSSINISSYRDKPLNFSSVKNEISKKEVSASRYKSRFDECWLVLVIPQLLMAPGARLMGEIACFKSKVFEKIIVFDEHSGVARGLGK